MPAEPAPHSGRDRIEIRDLSVEAVIGVNDDERQRFQPVVVNLVLFVDLRAAAASDQLADTLDYDALAADVVAHVRQARRHTVEALAADLASLCLGRPRVERVQVRVDKPQAVAAARSVGVTIEREREISP